MTRKIPYSYRTVVQNALIAAAAVSPLGLLGGIDAVGVGAVWTTMFLAIRNKSNSKLGADPKRICVGAASGIAGYYIGCKAATYACFFIPGVGPAVAILAALGVSAVCNIYFTYKFAVTSIELFEKNNYNDDDIISFFIHHLKQLPSVDEVKEIAEIYRS